MTGLTASVLSKQDHVTTGLSWKFLLYLSTICSQHTQTLPLIATSRHAPLQESKEIPSGQPCLLFKPSDVVTIILLILDIWQSREISEG